MSGSTSVRSPYTTASGNQTFLYHFQHFCDATKVPFIPFYSHTFLVCTDPFQVKRKRTIFFKKEECELLFSEATLIVFYIDFYFTLTFNLFFAYIMEL